jgi:hypothetical protein
MNNLMTANRQWATRPADQRFETLPALLASVEARRTKSMAAKVDIGEIEVKADAENLILTLGDFGVVPAVPTHWSFSQVCTALRAPTAWLREVPAELAVRNLEYALTRAVGERDENKQQLQAMVVTDDEGKLNTLQAMTGPTYGRIWDADVVSAVSKLVEKTGGKFYNPKAYNPDGGHGEEPKPSGLYASDRDCFMFLIDGGSKLDCGERAQLNRGIIVWNSEVGSRSFGLMTFLFNECCGNHIIWGAQNVNKLVIRHTEGGPTRFEKEVSGALLNHMNDMNTQDADTIRRSGEVKLADMVNFPNEGVLSEAWQKLFAEKHGFTRGELREAIAAAEREEGGCSTLWDMVQGLTAYARKFEHVDTRLNLETRAGKLLELVAN